MRIRILALVCLIACCAATVSAFAPQGTADPLSGNWRGDWGPSARDRNQVAVALKWDGKTLTGTVNPEANPIPLEKASFNAGTGVIHMEAKAPGRGGTLNHYIIDGKLVNGAISGSWNHQASKGDFKITKQ